MLQVITQICRLQKINGQVKVDLSPHEPIHMTKINIELNIQLFNTDPKWMSM